MVVSHDHAIFTRSYWKRTPKGCAVPLVACKGLMRREAARYAVVLGRSSRASFVRQVSSMWPPESLSPSISRPLVRYCAQTPASVVIGRFCSPVQSRPVSGGGKTQSVLHAVGLHGSLPVAWQCICAMHGRGCGRLDGISLARKEKG